VFVQRDNLNWTPTLVRTVLTAAATLIAAAILDRVNSPIWVFLLTLGIILIVAVFLHWFLATPAHKQVLGFLVTAYLAAAIWGAWPTAQTTPIQPQPTPSESQESPPKLKSKDTPPKAEPTPPAQQLFPEPSRTRFAKQPPGSIVAEEAGKVLTTTGEQSPTATKQEAFERSAMEHSADKTIAGRCEDLATLVALGRSLDEICRKTRCGNEAEIAKWTEDVRGRIVRHEFPASVLVAFDNPPQQGWAVSGFPASGPKLAILHNVNWRWQFLIRVISSPECR
jgi:hypothetical protein